MILIVGLGNPGPEYDSTRHNLGFLAVDAFAARSERVVAFNPRFDGQYAELTVAGARVGLLKPQTFMNASGRSVRAAARHFELPNEALLVVHDELDLGFGELRLKQGGGDGGHRGLRSISAELGGGVPNYGRLRIGIGRPPLNFEGDVADFVLQALAPEERSELDTVLARASEVMTAVIGDGLSQTMNRTNRRTVR